MAKTDKHHVTLPKEFTPLINQELEENGGTKSALFTRIIGKYFGGTKKKGKG